MVLLSIVAIGSGIALTQGLDSFTHISERSKNLLAARYALDRMVRELALSGDEAGTNLKKIQDDEIEFVDDQGNDAEFILSGTTLLRDDEILLENVTSLTFTGFDDENDETNSAPQVRRIGIQISTLPPGQTTPLSLRTYVFIRNYMYENFIP